VLSESAVTLCYARQCSSDLNRANFNLVSGRVFDVDEVLVIGDGVVLRQLKDANQGLEQGAPEPGVGAAHQGRCFADQPESGLPFHLKLRNNILAVIVQIYSYHTERLKI